MKTKLAMLGLAAGAILAGGRAQREVSQAGPAQSDHWEVVANPVYGTRYVTYGMSTLDMISPDEGWTSGPQMMHYVNGAWQFVDSPPYANMSGIDMLSSSEGWAVGRQEDSTHPNLGYGTILHYSGGKWTAVASPAGDTSLYALDMVSAEEGWAVGGSGTLLHYSNGRWEVAASPTTRGLEAVQMLSEDEGWALGYNRTILHYSNGQWTVVPPPDVPHDPVLTDVHMLSADEGWAVGSSGTILHYSAGSWQPVSSPTVYAIGSISMLSEDEGWAAGNELLHYSGGVWEVVNYPLSHCQDQILYEIEMLTASDGWAVGGCGLIIHYVQEGGGLQGMPLRVLLPFARR
jgi:photosystem II stability/assembly factor-like uncharacterized protein